MYIQITANFRISWKKFIQKSKKSTGRTSFSSRLFNTNSSS